MENVAVSIKSIGDKIADRIIEKTAHLFPFPTNIVDVNGYIIASTIPERIGTFHEGAAIMIKQKLNEIIVTRDNQYIGTKKGVTLPIRFKNDIIGGVGLTGAVERVIGYSKVLQSFTELIIENIVADEQAHLDEKTKDSLIQRWLLPACDIPEDEFIMQIENFRFRWKNKFSIIVVKIEKSFTLVKHLPLLQLLASRFAFTTDSSSNIFIANDQEIIWVTSINNKKIHESATLIKNESKYYGDITLLFGIGKQYTHYKEAYRSYSEAKKALALANSGNPYVHYDDNIFAIALNSISKDTQKECIDAVFKNCREDEIKMIADFIQVYYKCNGSINRISDVLAVHKNTVQYRINKINELLGLDIRNTKNLLHLFLACFFAAV